LLVGIPRPACSVSQQVILYTLEKPNSQIDDDEIHTIILFREKCVKNLSGVKGVGK
jgi:hypothetical protein